MNYNMKDLRDIFHNQIELFSDKWDPYFDVYETYFHKFTDKKVNVVEVGVQGGGSLQMWERYFGEQANIIGIDIDPHVLRNQSKFKQNTKLYLGNQASNNFWNNFLQEIEPIDVFIDDGSHIVTDQITTFENVFPKMNVGGIYICEDTHTNYWNEWGGSIYKHNTFIEYSKRLVEVINFEHIRKQELIDEKLLNVCRDITSIHFYDSMVVILKGGKKEFKNVHANGDLLHTIFS